eukprot:13628745-Alexandrium_andersonii.AAC.1
MVPIALCCSEPGARLAPSRESSVRDLDSPQMIEDRIGVEIEHQTIGTAAPDRKLDSPIHSPRDP